MSTGILSILDISRRHGGGVPHRVADGIKSAADVALHQAVRAAGFLRHEARLPLLQLKQDPLPALVALVGALCALRLLTRSRR